MQLSKRYSFQKEVTLSDEGKVFVQYRCQPGAKELPIVFCDGIGCSGYAWKYLIPILEKDHPIIHVHYRGHGKSETPANLDSIRIETFASDLQEVLAALNIPKALLVAHSMGVQVALEAYSLRPDRIAGLVLISGSPGKAIDTFQQSADEKNPVTTKNRLAKRLVPLMGSGMMGFGPLLQPLWKALIQNRAFYYYAKYLEMNGELLEDEDFIPYFSNLSVMENRNFGRLVKSMEEHDLWHLLAKIEVPALVVGGGKDTFCPHWVMNRVHNAIPNSENLYIRTASHTLPIEHPELLHARIQTFIEKRL